ncbi:hypothetical protein [Paenibacillus pinihumi]|uniref:hypothetical protein n=1 Tax=Paenibacillus pinihumi TaxID=669462 RepID=UPI0004916224|nr:hypothetical protein [Paenibacillus pinihumi]
MDFALFMIFSTIEGLATYALALYIFRMDLKKYIWHVLLIILLVNFQNYVIRDMLELSMLAPLVNIIISVLFFTTIVRVPIIWSFIMVLTGFLGFAIIQTAIIYFSFGYFSIEQVQLYTWKAYTVQTLCGLIGTFLGWFIYNKRLGFTFEFEKIRLKGERFFVIFLIAVSAIGLIVMVYFGDMVLNLIGFVVAMIIFLFYSIRKEVKDKKEW